MTTASQRRTMLRVMNLLIAHEPKVHYRQVRPMATNSIGSIAELTRLLKGSTGIVMDCSESVTLICRLAGLRDPNGLHYNGAGFTGTLLKNLPAYKNPQNAMVGALCVFGPGTGDHVCMVLEPGRDPLLFSHGQERGPLAIRLSSERQFQNAPVRFLSVAKLG